MTVKISSNGVEADGASLSIPPSDRELLSLFGTPRKEPIPLHGGRVRTRCVFDRHGVVIHRDDTPPEVSAMFFALSARDTPGFPARAFPGSLLLEGLPLLPDLTEARLTASNSIRLESEFSHSWHFQSSAFTVHLDFRRRGAGSSARTGVHRLAYVSLSFHSTK